MNNGRNQGIEVLPHDEDTFLIQSRTNREDYHLVDLSNNSCTCQGFQFRHSSIKGYECWHIKYIKKLLGIEAEALLKAA
jgi:hypothetical protein